jgi:hypothetical protein
VVRRGRRLCRGWPTGGIGGGGAVGGAEEEELGGSHTQGGRQSSAAPTREEEGGGGGRAIGLTRDLSHVRLTQLDTHENIAIPS